MHLGISKLLGKVVVNYVSTYTKDTLKTSAKDLCHDAYVMFFVCLFSFDIKAYVMGTHLNCIDSSMQFK